MYVNVHARGDVRVLCTPAQYNGVRVRVRKREDRRQGEVRRRANDPPLFLKHPLLPR
jgi:hypothetical protein